MKGFISTTSSSVKIGEVFSGSIYKIQVQEKLGFHLCTSPSHRLSPPRPNKNRSESEFADDQIKITSCSTFCSREAPPWFEFTCPERLYNKRKKTRGRRSGQANQTRNNWGRKVSCLASREELNLHAYQGCPITSINKRCYSQYYTEPEANQEVHKYSCY